MELSLLGLQNAGKTSPVNVIATGGFSEDMICTVGFNMRKVTKGNVTIKLWDLGGQPRFCGMGERYCRAVSAIVYVVDAADRENMAIARGEPHDLLSKPSLTGIPLLVIGNKIDKPEAFPKQSFTEVIWSGGLYGMEIFHESLWLRKLLSPNILYGLDDDLDYSLGELWQQLISLENGNDHRN